MALEDDGFGPAAKCLLKGNSNGGFLVGPCLTPDCLPPEASRRSTATGLPETPAAKQLFEEIAEST